MEERLAAVEGRLLFGRVLLRDMAAFLLEREEGFFFLGGVVVLFGGSGERERDFGELGAAS